MFSGKYLLKTLMIVSHPLHI